MYVPASPGLAPGQILGLGPRGALPYPLDRPSPRYFYVARSAIYHIARAIPIREGDPVVVPEYHSGNETKALRAAGAQLRYVSMDRTLTLDLDAMRRRLKEGARAVLVIHYLGWPQPIETIRDLCREHGATLIEDCALAFLSERNGRFLGTEGDHSVFCLYKTLPVPNGAVLAENGAPSPEIAALRLREPGALSTAARGAELFIAWARGRAGAAGAALAGLKAVAGRALDAARVRRVPVGDMGFALENTDLAMSPWARSLLTRFDYGEIRSRRRANFLRLLERLDGSGMAVFPTLPDGVCPLFFPLLVPDKAAASRALLGRGIESVQFWNQGDREAETDPSTESARLRRHLLELPIHQDLTPDQIDHIAEAVHALASGR